MTMCAGKPASGWTRVALDAATMGAYEGFRVFQKPMYSQAQAAKEQQRAYDKAYQQSVGAKSDASPPSDPIAQAQKRKTLLASQAQTDDTAGKTLLGA